MSNKNLLILERSGSSLVQKSEDGAVVLEGVFTEIGVKNKNNRIYEEAEVLPHIKELQNKVKTSKLLGELDHPKSFDISLGNVSHVIEKLEYDPSTKKVMGRIRLLNTDKGIQARKLIEDGIPLHISSRAAGNVDENGKVSIKKLFTYDLVADPGFENAELKRVNESYGFSDSDDLFIYEIGESYETEKNNDKYQNNTKVMENSVSVEDFNKYSEYLKDEITSLKEELKSSSEKHNKMDKLVQYAEHIAENYNKLQKYVEYLAENLDSTITESQELKSYTNYLAENLDKNISYANYLAENLDNSISYSNYIGENLEKSINYQEYLAESLDKNISYANYLAENLDKSISYQEYLAENADKLIGYTNYLKENIETVGNYSEYVAESVNKIVESGSIMVQTPTNTVSESTVNESKDYKSSIEEKLNALVESAKAEKVEEQKSDLHFLRFLNESKRNEFKSLTEEKQTLLVEAFKTNNYFGAKDVEYIWESTFVNKPEKLNFITNMPEKYMKQWEALSESHRNAIVAQSNLYPLNTQYQIDNFWQTRDLRPVQVSLQTINESKVASEEVVNESQNAYLESIRASVARKMGREL